MNHSLPPPLRTLYLCYFGLREPLVQTQVLPYLRQLAGAGVDVSLLTFEPHLRQNWTTQELNRERAHLADEGIRWFRRAYHKKPSALATAYDILSGAWSAVRLVRRHRIGVLHARSHVPMAMAMLAQRLAACRLVFDIRGLMAEEYADAGVWKDDSLRFRAVKKLERAGIRRADQIVVLTRRMRDWLVEGGLAAAEKIEVIPCCVDFTRYGDEGEPATDASVAPTSRFEVVYAGSVTGLYLLDEMGHFFIELLKRRPDAFLRILTTSSSEDVAAVLRKIGLSSDKFWIGGVLPSEVPAYLRRARLGLSFRRATFSQIAASPTKIPEYLAAGLPLVSNTGIGDVDELLEKEKVGVIVRAFSPEEYGRAVEQALALTEDAEVRLRCAAVARRRFSLNCIGRTGYGNVYQRIHVQMRSEEVTGLRTQR